ncbi:MAG: bacteriocin [Erysipelotrichaceae bacterium]|nr:bacteriocin [Erysipelotrichaceae bacterium]
MAKTKEELKELKHEYESLTAKLNELTDDELKQVTGGALKPNRSNDPIEVGKWYGKFVMIQEGPINIYYYCKADLGNGLYSFIVVDHTVNKGYSYWTRHGETISNGLDFFYASVPPEAQKLVL